MFISRKNKIFLIKCISFLSLIRAFNILIMMLAQILSASFIFAPEKGIQNVINDLNFWLIILSTSLSIAGGYIFNAFFDEEKDLINRPQKTLLERRLSSQTKLIIFFGLNLFAIVAASYVSFRAVLFYVSYIGVILIYSLLLKRILIIGNIVSSLLTILPFFAITVYFKNLNFEIITHASYLYVLILIRELTKDLRFVKGDLTQKYQTIPVVFGIQVTKNILTLLIVLTFFIILVLHQYFEINMMFYYFSGAVVALSIFCLILWSSERLDYYKWLHHIIRIVIVSGVLSLPLLRISL